MSANHNDNKEHEMTKTAVTLNVKPPRPSVVLPPGIGRSGARGVSCARCGARPARACVTSSGSESKGFHVARERAHASVAWDEDRRQHRLFSDVG